MKSRWDKFADATFTEPFESPKEAASGKRVGQTEPSTTKYYQTNNTLSPFDAQKLDKEDQLVKLAKAQIVTSAMSTQIYDPSNYSPLNLPKRIVLFFCTFLFVASALFSTLTIYSADLIFDPTSK